MNSAGNDIVALAAIDVARTRQSQFYSRIVTPAELKLYSTQLKEQLPFEHFVWLAWSVKESTYKFLKRFEPQLIFSPSKIAIDTLNFSGEYFEGTARYGDQVLYSKSFVNQDYIFSIVNDQDDFSAIHYEIKRIDSAKPDDQSNVVRELLLSALNGIFPGNSLQVAKHRHGWPLIVSGDNELPIPVSFTHHGYFVAYTFCLTQSLWKAHQHHAEIL
ncbi:MAG: 4'-phosphopantetheinyl transferase superfamily protein [Bacteroidetes bacterium]|nr:4'-phosphopantetheinyl transferase superfamily protein [Bacteroidota bacterium]